MSVRRDMLTSVIAVLACTLVLGLGYPLAVTAVSQLAFKDKANGERVNVSGRLAGSKLIGQAFTRQLVKAGKPQVDANGNPVTAPDPRYFQSRPSATVPPDNAAGSSFSNLGPNNKVTEQAIAANVQAYLQLERRYTPGLSAAGVPVDAADSSASGLDPDISQANARIQANRVAAVRRISRAAVLSEIAQHTDGRTLGVFGEPGVNVLELNLALNRMGEDA
ncbi:MAG TPA: potassium-transporting ATPase subunit C [Solirubrobacteraceae bacterium]|nr:potassium-transporting ATPase subunit C [Solirubrobacteraceae bacterium]